MKMTIRHATMDDLKVLAQLEASCFPPSEAASEEQLCKRIQFYGNHFWLLYEEGELRAFADGFVSDQPDLSDDMYAHADQHRENGAWQMIFGVNTHPAHRNQGYATKVLKRAIAESREQGRCGVVLTCKENMIPFYRRFGFEDEGVSVSEHGGACWHQMRLMLKHQKPEMRRKDREVTNKEDIERILDSGRIVHLGLMDAGVPYVVPLHYGYEWENGTLILFLHSAKAGHKLDLVRRNPACFVEIDCEMNIISGEDNPCRYGAAYASVMGKGIVEILNNTEEKIHGLKTLMLHQTGRMFHFEEDAANAVCVWRIKVDSLSGKQRKMPE